MRTPGFTRILIVSCSARTGTTLMAELMVNGFRIDAFVEHEMSIFARPATSRRLVVTKMPTEIRVVGPLLRWWRDLWIVNLVRDPRDVIVSFHGGVPGKYYVGLNQWKACYPAARRLKDHPRVITVRYEDLVTDPDAVQDQIARRMPFLERTIAFSEFHSRARPSASSQRALRGVRPVSAASVGSWRQHKPRVVGQLQRHGPVTRELIELGYERDDAWLRELAGVAPDTSPSDRRERFTLRQRAAFLLWRYGSTARCLLSREPRTPVIEN